MAQLPDPPVLEQNQDSYMWRHWFKQLHDYITRAGQLGWTQINFTGSNITSILLRDHNQLQGLQGGSTSERYHITSAEATDLAQLAQIKLLTGYTFATLPTAAAGMIAQVTDSNTVVWGANIAGGGANNVLAYYNGANWTVAAI